MVLYRSPEIQFHSAWPWERSKNDLDVWYILVYISMYSFSLPYIPTFVSQTSIVSESKEPKLISA